MVALNVSVVQGVPVADLEGFLWFLQKPPFETRRNPSEEITMAMHLTYINELIYIHYIHTWKLHYTYIFVRQHKCTNSNSFLLCEFIRIARAYYTLLDLLKKMPRQVKDGKLFQARSKVIQIGPASFHPFLLHKNYNCLKILEYKPVYAFIPPQQYFPIILIIVIIIYCCNSTNSWSKQFLLGAAR